MPGDIMHAEILVSKLDLADMNSTTFTLQRMGRKLDASVSYCARTELAFKLPISRLLGIPPCYLPLWTKRRGIQFLPR